MDGQKRPETDSPQSGKTNADKRKSAKKQCKNRKTIGVPLLVRVLAILRWPLVRFGLSLIT